MFLLEAERKLVRAASQEGMPAGYPTQLQPYRGPFKQISNLQTLLTFCSCACPAFLACVEYFKKTAVKTTNNNTVKGQIHQTRKCAALHSAPWLLP